VRALTPHSLVAAVSNAFVALAIVGCSGEATSASNTGAPHPEIDAQVPPSATDAEIPPSETGARGAPSAAEAGVPPSTDASGPIAATMNDVSILFPLPLSQSDVDNLLPPSARGDLGTLVPSAVYSSMGFVAGSTFPDGGVPDGAVGQSIAAYGNLRVVAMRIDPCFASLDPDPHGVGCTAQIRLVFQEVDWADGATTFDSALHAFYNLTRGEFLALTTALVELRVANASANGETGGPLAPHPIMVRQGLDGAMSTGVERLILQYAGEKNLVRLAQLSGFGAGIGGTWTMSAFDVGQGSTATPRVIPTLAADAGSVQSEFIESDFGGSGSGSGSGSGAGLFEAEFGPTTASDDDYTPLDNGDPTSLSAQDRQAAFDAVVRVENPADNSANTIDCASCHMATPTERLVAMPLFSLDDTTSPLAFQPDGTYVTKADLAPTFQNQPNNRGPISIHAFSYFGALPSINQRTANETAAIVEYLNRLQQ
jgi:hypothetical protein